MIRLLSLPLILTSGISLVVGCFFLLLYRRLKSHHEEVLPHYLLFALLALASGTFLGSFAVVLNSGGNLDRLNLYNRVTIVAAMYTVSLAVHFYVSFFRYRPPVPLAWLHGGNLVFLLLCLFSNPYFLAKQLHPTSRYYTGLAFGPAFMAWGAWIIAMSLYGILILALVQRGMQGAPGQQARGPVRALIGATLVWLLAGIADTLTGLQLIDLPPLTWVGAFLITLSTAWTLVLQIETLYQERRQLNDRLIRDHLTQAFSRSYFELRLDHAIAALQRGTLEGLYVCVLDVDDFKSINDRFGHWVGDKVLKHIVQALETSTRAPDCAARLGGDEFAVLLLGVEGDEVALSIVERMRRTISHGVSLPDTRPQRVTCSFGLAGAGKPDGLRPNLGERLLNSADEALYRSKRAGKDTVTVAPLGNDPQRQPR